MVSPVPRRVGGRTVIEFQSDDLVWALYARESDADDLEQVSAQLADLRPFAVGIGGRIGKEFPENSVSAYKRRRVLLPDGTYGFRVVRPDWDAMMTGLRRGVYNAVACVNIDRGMRDPRDLEDLIDLVEQYGVLVKGMTGSIDLTTDDGIASARNQVNQRNNESRNISRRISTGNRRSAFKGKNHGGGSRPFGWRKDKQRINKREAALIKATATRLVAGVAPRTVAREWNDRGTATVRGGQWTANTILQIFTNPRLCGWRTYRGEILRDGDGRPVSGEWERILSEREYEDLARTLGVAPSREVRAGRGKGKGTWTKFLLSGLARCGKCHARMTGSYVVSKSGDKYPIYRCRAKGEGGCGGCSRKAELVDKHIIALVIAEQKKRQFRRLDTVPQTWDGQQRLVTVTRKIAEATAQYKADRMSGARYFALVEDLENEERSLRAARRRHDAKHAAQRAAVVNLAAEWQRPDFTLEQRQAAIAASIAAVVIHPAGRHRINFDPDRIEVVWRDEETETAA